MFVRALALIALFASFGFGGIACAEDRAATSELPAALASLGVANTQVVTVSEAQNIRGQGYRHHHHHGLGVNIRVNANINVVTTNIIQVGRGNVAIVGNSIRNSIK